VTPLPTVEGPADLGWDRLRRWFPEVDDLIGCPQDPDFHGEGDVAVHTRLVVAALAEDPRFWDLPPTVRSEVATAAVLHDIGKPSTIRIEDGRIRQPGHARRGATLTRLALWQRAVAPAARERVANLVQLHLVPFHLLDRERPLERLYRASWTCGGLDTLLILAAADASGRVSSTRSDLLDRVGLARLLAEEHGVVAQPYPFGSDQARVQWFRRPDRDPAYVPFDDATFEVVVLSGLPASGKDHWIRHHGDGRPVIGLDDLRAVLGVVPGEGQGRVVAAARDRARVELRARRPFIWNATNLSRRVRAGVVGLALDYGARVRIVATEVSPSVLAARNASRRRPVPEAVLARMLRIWEPPDPTEAHVVQTVASDPEEG
jgi:predicted kinase